MVERPAHVTGDGECTAQAAAAGAVQTGEVLGRAEGQWPGWLGSTSPTYAVAARVRHRRRAGCGPGASARVDAPAPPRARRSARSGADQWSAVGALLHAHHRHDLADDGAHDTRPTPRPRREGPVAGHDRHGADDERQHDDDDGGPGSRVLPVPRARRSSQVLPGRSLRRIGRSGTGPIPSIGSISQAGPSADGTGTRRRLLRRRPRRRPRSGRRRGRAGPRRTRRGPSGPPGCRSVAVVAAAHRRPARPVQQGEHAADRHEQAAERRAATTTWS